MKITRALRDAKDTEKYIYIEVNSNDSDKADNYT